MFEISYLHQLFFDPHTSLYLYFNHKMESLGSRAKINKLYKTTSFEKTYISYYRVTSLILHLFASVLARPRRLTKMIKNPSCSAWTNLEIREKKPRPAATRMSSVLPPLWRQRNESQSTLTRNSKERCSITASHTKKSSRKDTKTLWSQTMTSFQWCFWTRRNSRNNRKSQFQLLFLLASLALHLKYKHLLRRKTHQWRSQTLK